MTDAVLLLACGAIVAAVVLGALLLPTRVASAVRALLSDRLDGFERGQEKLERSVRDEVAKNRDESTTSGRQLREEVRASLKDTNDSVLKQMAAVADLQKVQLEGFGGQIGKLTEASERRLDGLRVTVDERLKALQDDNAKRLDQMRQTVDEKLQGTLEKRLGESFKLVSERLEAVQRGLGEMQTLANGVGDLKKVLANVKVRGTWGEIQLGSLLEQMLAQDQYVKNVATRKGSDERVEFAVRLPGPEEVEGEEVLLPIDAKFPLEDYQRLCEAAERGDAEAVEECGRQLELRIKACARDIHDKYLNPPRTTDFGVLFLPTEGLYAEVLRRPGLAEKVQRDFKVSLAGPTTLAALLNSLQMGFRTLAIQRRSSEVWNVLGAVKAEFGKFGAVLEKVEKKLQEASNTLHDVGKRRRAIERQLKDVQELPATEARALQPESEARPAEALEEGDAPLS